MKLNLIILIGLVLFTGLLRAQNNTSPQTISVQNLSVGYKSNDNLVPDSIILTQPELSFTIENNSDVSEIELKIYRADNNTVLFSKTYVLSQAPLTDESGKVIFSKEGDHIVIKPSVSLALNMYRYEIVTKNAQGESGFPFSDLK